MYHSIVVPLDGSVFSEHALPVAATVARRAGAALHLVRVNSAPIVAEVARGFSTPDVRFWEEDRAYLTGVAQRLASTAGVSASVDVLDGPVVESLLEYAIGRRADLVIMTTHGRGPFSRFWLGSVADQLVSRLPMPLLLVRPQTALPTLNHEPGFRRQLIALDGSPRAEAILPPAVELGRLMGSSFVLLRAVEWPPVYGVDLTGYALAGTEIEVFRRLHAEALDYLEKTADRLRREGLEVQTRVADRLHPAAAILEEAAALSCDLIALDTHGRHGVPRLFLGSVADKVVRGAPVSVLLHRSLTPRPAPEGVGP